MTNYQITIGYKAVICADVRAENEEQAKEIALKQLQNFRAGANKGKLNLQDDTYTVAGVLDMDASWGQI